MELLHIINSGSYLYAQRGWQVVPAPWIALNLRGLLRADSWTPSGKQYTHFSVKEEPFVPYLTLSVPGFVMDFEYDASRENWVLMAEGAPWHFSEKDGRFYLDCDGVELPIPWKIPLPPREVAPLREDFQRITEDFYSTIPRNLLAARLRATSLLERFLKAPQPEDDAVERFRKRLEEDRQWSKSIEEHCRELGCNRDLLRQNFRERYKIAPGEYRIRKRLQEILRLFAYSTLSMKEIAAAVGMKNETHLNQLLHDRYGKTPSQLCRQYRQEIRN